MHRYPTKPGNITSIEQVCFTCETWFQLSEEEVKAVATTWNTSKGFAPVNMCTCTHCGQTQIAVMPGKYDRPNAPKRNCGVQHVVVDF